MICIYLSIIHYNSSTYLIYIIYIYYHIIIYHQHPSTHINTPSTVTLEPLSLDRHTPMFPPEILYKNVLAALKDTCHCQRSVPICSPSAPYISLRMFAPNSLNFELGEMDFSSVEVTKRQSAMVPCRAWLGIP